MEYLITVTGMECAHCKEMIQQRLMELDEVLSVEAVTDQPCFTILSDEPLIDEAIKKVIEEDHRYTVQSIVCITDEEQTHTVCCSGKHKERSEKEQKELLNRLKRIEGQVRGVENMLEKDAYCTDVLVQVSAISAALNSFNKVLLANHVRTCVADNIRAGDDTVIDELVTLLQKLMK